MSQDNYFYNEIAIANADFLSQETFKFPTTMTHMIIVNEGSTNANVIVEWSFCPAPHPLHGRLKPRFDGPLSFDGLNVSKIWLRRTGTGLDPIVRVWAWRRGGG